MRGFSPTTSRGATDRPGRAPAVSPREPAAGPFVAIDFETADRGPDSACALALVRVDGTVITDRALFMIRPPRRQFEFTSIHGIAWRHVAAEPTFGELWGQIAGRFAGAIFLAAHNASFDRGVLAACCRAAGVSPPPHDFHCTVRLARRAWNLRPANLPAVCAHLGIRLRHHDPASDAEACARIVIAAREQGVALGPAFLPGERRQ